MRFILLLTISLLIFNPYYVYAVDFDGTDDFIRGTFTGFTATYPFSISVWVKIDAAGNDVFAFIGDKDSATEFATLVVVSGGQVAMVTRVDAGSAVTDPISSTGDLSGSWINVIGIWRGATDREIYVDGVTEGVDDGTSLAAPDIDRASLGVNDRNYPYGEYAGEITEFYVWNSDISTSANNLLLLASKVKGIGLQIQSATLQLYWALDDEADATSGDGDTFVDRTGNGYDGVGDDGANNTGCTAKGEEILSYP